MPGTVVGPSGMVFDGIFVPRDCSSSAAASVLSGCSSSKVSSTGLGEVKAPRECSYLSIMGTVCRHVLSDVLHFHADENAVCGSRLMKMGCTLSQNGIGDGSNVQVLRRLRGGAGAYLDIPVQWKCKVCHGTRCWPAARKRCYRCDTPRDTVPNSSPWVRWGDRLLSRVALVLQLGAQGLVTFHRGRMVLEVCPLRGGVGPSLVGTESGKKGEAVSCCRL